MRFDELIDRLESVSDCQYDQFEYATRYPKKQRDCGCIAHHFAWVIGKQPVLGVSSPGKLNYPQAMRLLSNALAERAGRNVSAQEIARLCAAWWFGKNRTSGFTPTRQEAITVLKALRDGKDMDEAMDSVISSW